MMKLQGLIATVQSLFGGRRPTFGFVVLPFFRLCCSLVPLVVGVALFSSLVI